MYEQYTDKQIVEMLKPKLEKLGWGNVVNNDLYPDTIKMIATIYRSAYIRGQLGRSFIIGEVVELGSDYCFVQWPKGITAGDGVWACRNIYLEKATEHWVAATETNLKPGVKVRYLNAEMHKQSPECYPAQGTVGEVIAFDDDNTCLVQWLGYTNAWYASRFDLEVLLCE